MKTISKEYYLLFWLTVISVFQFACTPESCLEETQSYIKATFYANDGTGKIKPPDTLTIYGVGKEENLIYNKAIRQSSVLLPLDASTESCQFIFKINNIIDTVTFAYSSYPHFISKECGYTFYHKLDSVFQKKPNKIDHIYLLSKSVIIPHEENIKIFY
jgi:hypothetical protein